MTPTERLREAIRQIVESEPDIDAAVIRGLAFVQQEQLADALAADAIRDMVQAAVYARRATLREPPKAAAISAAEQAQAASVFARSLLDTWYVGSKRLGDCCAADLTPEARQLRAQAGGLLTHAVFYERLADKCGAQPVRTVCSDSDIVTLLNNISKATGEAAA